jgi:hypothetical protein
METKPKEDQQRPAQKQEKAEQIDAELWERYQIYDVDLAIERSESLDVSF